MDSLGDQRTSPARIVRDRRDDAARERDAAGAQRANRSEQSDSGSARSVADSVSVSVLFVGAPRRLFAKRAERIVDAFIDDSSGDVADFDAVTSSRVKGLRRAYGRASGPLYELAARCIMTGPCSVRWGAYVLDEWSMR